MASFDYALRTSLKIALGSTTSDADFPDLPPELGALISEPCSSYHTIVHSYQFRPQVNLPLPWLTGSNDSNASISNFQCDS